MSDALFRIEGVHHTYLPGTPFETLALRGADLTVREGTISALIGAEGAGKTTLTHFCNGLLRPAEPGRVRVLGCDTADPDLDLRQLRIGVGLVFQHPHHQLFERYVGDDVAYGPRKLGLGGLALRDRVRWAMEAVGLGFEEFKDRHAFTLSGGEMRRAAIAGVLAMQPRLLILDEATTGLDPEGRGRVHELLRRLRDDEGITILIVSNDMDEVAELAEYATLLCEGQTIASGTTRQVFAAVERRPECGLLPPEVARLARRLREQGLAIDEGVLTAAEAEEAIWQALRA